MYWVYETHQVDLIFNVMINFYMIDKLWFKYADYILSA